MYVCPKSMRRKFIEIDFIYITLYSLHPIFVEKKSALLMYQHLNACNAA